MAALVEAQVLMAVIWVPEAVGQVDIVKLLYQQPSSPERLVLTQLAERLEEGEPMACNPIAAAAIHKASQR
jgi:hypothetical protein